ncbi:threonine--tRNA ligase [Coxiella-like endosymbiont of Amblyomma americanum]|uniref:threonine--tRNA ligase n=1 Tax=Coxiella-like endosymbiont of Amblyomma americanum TaxID=1987500 RepID=UPI000F89D985|nr:threonine--tRNA ligase [Coxiella-like endosymbiont of Amblyomma americanum]AUJ58688.1 threonine--tRNA ligase [Coxiella-like endosymbiont of Amblyomma americanum]
MPIITLPCGNIKAFPEPVTVNEIIASLEKEIFNTALAITVDGHWVDVSSVITKDSTFKIITAKDPEGLKIIRHSTIHLLAHAVKELFPETKIAIGSVIDDRFYYDFDLKHFFTTEDLKKIEKKMRAIVKSDLHIERKILSREEALIIFNKIGEKYKGEIVNEIPKDEILTVYKQGNFIDLCRNLHVLRTGLLSGAFKLTKLSGVYWKGNRKNAVLQRIYGTAWIDIKDLKDYLHRMEESKDRDHRIIKKKMDLFHFQIESPGNVFWHSKGWGIILRLQDYIRNLNRKYGYQEVNTPQLIEAKLWDKSGHLEKFGEGVFSLTMENQRYVIKPMSCPAHIQIFNHSIKSYRDLPIHYSEFGICHRNESSGALHALMRLKSFIQDDGHIFCTEEQIHLEVSTFIDQLRKVYTDFGFKNIIYKLSTRPEKRVGNDEIWTKAEQSLSEALDEKCVHWEISPGKGAFYGPKIEFSLQDCLGRIWQCGTVQIDFSMPKRLGAYYIDEKGCKKTPVMIHRAILGSFERFLGILLEEYSGKLPLWLTPIQVVVMNITNRQNDYVEKIVENLQNLDIRAISDLRNEKIGFKIREHTIARVPYQVIVGDREVIDKTVTVRVLQGDVKLTSLTLEEFSHQLKEQISRCS